MLGEHGNLQFAPWSCVSFRGMPLDAWAETDERFRFDRMALQEASIGGGWVTFSGKQCTEYGIATTAARMAYIVLHDEKATCRYAALNLRHLLQPAPKICRLRDNCSRQNL